MPDIKKESARIISHPASGYSIHELCDRLQHDSDDIEGVIIGIKWKSGNMSAGWTSGMTIPELYFSLRVIEEELDRIRFEDD